MQPYQDIGQESKSSPGGDLIALMTNIEERAWKLLEFNLVGSIDADVWPIVIPSEEEDEG